jgi:drug/metabolite transporter (DMT)-like permease
MPAPSDDSARATRRGILLICISQALFMLSDGFSKQTSPDLPTGEILAIRGVFTVVLTGAVAAWTGALRHLAAVYSKPLVVRNLAELGSSFFFFTALFELPLANVTSIFQTQPLMLVASLAIVYGQRIGWRRWLALVAGLLGVLLIIRPGTEAFSWWAVSALVGVVFSAIRDLATSRLPRETPTPLVTFLTAVIVAATGCALGLTETWVVPPADHVARLGAAGLLVVAGSLMLIGGLRSGDLAQVAPFRHSAVLWAMLFGYLMLAEVPDAVAMLGAAIVVGAGFYMLNSRAAARR